MEVSEGSCRAVGPERDLEVDVPGEMLYGSQGFRYRSLVSAALPRC